MLVPCILASAMFYYYEPTSEFKDFLKAITAFIPLVVFFSSWLFFKRKNKINVKDIISVPSL